MLLQNDQILHFLPDLCVVLVFIFGNIILSSLLKTRKESFCSYCLIYSLRIFLTSAVSLVGSFHSSRQMIDLFYALDYTNHNDAVSNVMAFRFAILQINRFTSSKNPGSKSIPSAGGLSSHY